MFYLIYKITNKLNGKIYQMNLFHKMEKEEVDIMGGLA